MKNLLLDFVNEIAPSHTRTSCSDENSNGNEYFNEMGYPRCVRCALLYRLKEGIFPYDARVTELTIRLEE
jgi:hypothetical protein